MGATVSGKKKVHRKRTPRGRLTLEQQQLAERYLPMARKMAVPMKKYCPSEWEEYESAACLALVEAAEAYEPDRRVKFTTFARRRIWGALQDVHRKRLSKSAAMQPGQIPEELHVLHRDLEYCGRVLLTEPEEPVGLDLEAIDAVESWLKKLPRGHAAACRQIYVHGKTHEEAAKSLGLSPSRVTYIHIEAMAMLGGNWDGRRPTGRRQIAN